jgi:hypothetical protein
MKKGFSDFLCCLYIQQMATKKSQIIYNCIKCNYTTTRKSDFNKHLMTPKHCATTLDNQKVATDKSYQCACGKEYNHRGSLHKHLRVCATKSQPQGNIMDPELIYEIIKQNQNLIMQNTDFKAMLLEQQKALNERGPIINSYNTNNNNTNNNNTNILVMLNEKCKDAMNMSDFLKTLEITLEHLNSTKDGGLAKGVIYTFLDKIKQLDIHERPIHCSDMKRETLYIKDNDLWAKDKDHVKMKYAINRIAFLQRKSLDIWTKANPGYEASTAKLNDEYLNLLTNSMQCLIEKNEEGKVIRNICKDIHIDKEEF